MTAPKHDLWRAAAARLSRRDFFGAGAMAAFAAAFGWKTTAAPSAAAAAARATYEENVYTRLFGVKPVIGAFETLTRYGNSRLSPEVLAAMAEATEYFVDVEELNRAAGQKIAQIMHAESAIVTSCSFASMLLGTAACLSGTDREKVAALPQPTWPKREVVMQKGHRDNSYDRAYHTAGANLIVVDTGQEMINAISSERTAMIASMGMVERAIEPGVLTPKEVFDIGKRAGVPVLIDAAGELPPASKLTRYTDLGADLVVFSGGKAIQGPSSTGILAGRKDLIEAAFMNSAPNAAIGRGMKVGREEIVGLWVALEQFLKIDEKAQTERWTKSSRLIHEQLQGIPGLTATLRKSPKGFEDVLLSWDQKVIPLTPAEAGLKLKNGQPRIAYMTNAIHYAFTGPTIVPTSLKPGEDVIVAKRLKEFFSQEAKSKPTAAV